MLNKNYIKKTCEYIGYRGSEKRVPSHQVCVLVSYVCLYQMEEHRGGEKGVLKVLRQQVTAGPHPEDVEKDSFY